MRWTSGNAWGLLLAVLLITACSVLLLQSASPEKRITIYSPGSTYSLNIVERGGHEYVGLLEILEPLGRVASRSEGQKWKLRFKNIDAQFTVHSSKARIGRREVDLTAPFILQNDRGLVALDSLATLLAPFLEAPVTFHSNARRLFIQQPGTTYSAEVTSTPSPKLSLNFSAPVNPTIGTDGGKVTLVFSRDPVIASGTANINLADKTITAAVFQEDNGAAEITVTGTVPLMASFSNNGRTITIAPAPAAATPQSSPALPAPATASSGGAMPAATPNTAPAPAPPRFLVAIDASHGGEERGAALADNLLEKDVTLALARRLRQQLESRGIATAMLRDGDI